MDTRGLTPVPRLRVLWRGVLGWLLIVAGVAVIVHICVAGPRLSGKTIGAIELLAAGGALLCYALRRRADRTA